MFMNMLALSVSVVNAFIERNILGDLMNVWAHLHHVGLNDHVGSNVGEKGSHLRAREKLAEVYKMREIIIDSLYNMTVMLTANRRHQMGVNNYAYMQHLDSMK